MRESIFWVQISECECSEGAMEREENESWACKSTFLEHFGRSMEPSQVFSGIKSNGVLNVFGLTRSRYRTVIIFKSIIRILSPLSNNADNSLRTDHPCTYWISIDHSSIAHVFMDRNCRKQNVKLKKTWHFRRLQSMTFIQWQSMGFIQKKNMKFVRWEKIEFVQWQNMESMLRQNSTVERVQIMIYMA